MKWDFSISMGSILSMLIFILTLLKLHAANVRKITRMEMKIDQLYSWFEDEIIFGQKSTALRKRDVLRDRAGSVRETVGYPDADDDSDADTETDC